MNQRGCPKASGLNWFDIVWPWLSVVKHKGWPGDHNFIWGFGMIFVYHRELDVQAIFYVSEDFPMTSYDDNYDDDFPLMK